MNAVERRRLELAKKCVRFGKFEYASLVIGKLMESQTIQDDAELLAEISKLYISMGKNRTALTYSHRAFDLEKNVDNLELLANVNFLCENYEDAAIEFEELLKYKDDERFIEYCCESYNKMDIKEEAIRIAKLGIEKFNTVNAYSRLSFLYITIGMEKEAIECCEEMKEKFANNSVTYNNLGFLYEAIYNDYEKAKEYFKKAAKLGLIEAYYNLGVCCKQSEDLKNAEKYLKKIISLNPDIKVDYNYTLGSVYMAQRKLALGYKYYQKRSSSNALKLRYKNKLWNGKDYPEEVLYVHSEQGFGDNIQFIRYIPIVAKKFKKVIYAVPVNLLELFQYSFSGEEFSNIEIVSIEETVRCNKFALIMDLPYLLHANFHNIPSKEGYLKVSERSQELFKTNFFKTDKIKIGLNWRAKGMGLRDAVYRTIDAPYYFKDFLDIPEVDYYSFQMGDIFGMCEKYPNIIDISKQINTFNDTAAALKNLDILITVDTALAHLAGALGVKTYLLLCHAPDWRWFDNDKKTEWYSSVTIIKQQDRKTWEDVAEKLNNYIRKDIKNINID